jgi:hypothetical protein
MNGRRTWLLVVLALVLGAGVVVASMKLLPASPGTPVDPIRLESPDRSGDDRRKGSREGRAGDRRRSLPTSRGPSSPAGQSSPEGAPAAPPAPPVPAGDDDDGDETGDDDDDD